MVKIGQILQVVAANFSQIFLPPFFAILPVFLAFLRIQMPSPVTFELIRLVWQRNVLGVKCPDLSVQHNMLAVSWTTKLFV
jgi:hypothetical protein